MSDAHGPEEATRESAGSGSAVGVDDAPRTHDDHDEAEDTTGSVEHEVDDAHDEDQDHGVEDHDAEDAEDHDDAENHDADDVEDHDDERESDDADDDTVHAHDDDSDEQDDAENGRSRASGRTGLFVAIGVAALAVIGVLVLLAAFVWPDFTGPGKPDDAANQAVSALSSKDPAGLDKIGCKRTDGKQSVQLPPQILQLIQSATPSGPPHQTLDSEARQTINLTLGAQGQTQSAPVDMVLAVNDGSWCLNNIEAGQ